MQNLSPPASETPLLEFLLAALAPMNRTRVKQLLRSGRVVVNGASVTRHDHTVRPADKVGVAREAPPAPPSASGLEIVHEDAHLVVIDKPPGLLTVATESEKLDTAFVRLSDYLRARNAGRPFVVHRLDRDTSGLLLFARSAEVRDQLQRNWEELTKTYLAVVEGRPEAPEGAVENYLTEGRDLRVRASPRPGPDAKRAASRYTVRQTRGGYSLVEVEIETGRKHQIRVHLAGLGCPVAGDKMYGATTDPVRRLALHAWRLSFDHPFTLERLELEAPLPPALARIVG
ncbi:RluA family pseudouridine synthase [Gemmata sp. JC673]|uniref:Pseudouridine synthase n=1 Tax=Gemmata algarum TaxID=2975278 RepID=A0ABU5F7C7_9BACT|nr:RluA family pseudouridine synthase [Gemmata algarum]MDY3562228.1 RluA family pseudouridine synthase [Gemmata algarum]